MGNTVAVDIDPTTTTELDIAQIAAALYDDICKFVVEHHDVQGNKSNIRIILSGPEEPDWNHSVLRDQHETTSESISLHQTRLLLQQNNNNNNSSSNNNNNNSKQSPKKKLQKLQRRPPKNDEDSDTDNNDSRHCQFPPLQFTPPRRHSVPVTTSSEAMEELYKTPRRHSVPVDALGSSTTPLSEVRRSPTNSTGSSPVKQPKATIIPRPPSTPRGGISGKTLFNLVDDSPDPAILAIEAAVAASPSITPRRLRSLPMNWEAERSNNNYNNYNYNSNSNNNNNLILSPNRANTMPLMPATSPMKQNTTGTGQQQQQQQQDSLLYSARHKATTPAITTTTTTTTETETDTTTTTATPGTFKLPPLTLPPPRTMTSSYSSTTTESLQPTPWRSSNNNTSIGSATTRTYNT